MKFARLFDIGEEQLMVYTELDPERDTTIIHNITDTEICRIDTKLEVKSVDHVERAAKYVATMTYEQAEKIMNDMREMLNN